jgi:peptide/nickel transport system permease protein
MNTTNRVSDTTPEKNENEIASRETEGLSQRQIIFKRFVKHKAAMASLITLIAIFVMVYSSLGLTIGFGNFKFSFPGWWGFSISDIDPEGAIAAACNGGVSGCPTLDLAP